MNARRPVASKRSTALPTLVALLATGAVAEGCLSEAHAQTPPQADAGVRRPTPPPPTPPPPGGIMPVRPHPQPPPQPPPPPDNPPDGGLGKVKP